MVTAFRVGIEQLLIVAHRKCCYFIEDLKIERLNTFNCGRP